MSDIQQGLLIAAIGMGLVFAVIIFLWGLMALMMKLTSGKEQREEPVENMKETDASLVPEMQSAESQRRAAAAAVAVEMALSFSRGGSKKRKRDYRDELSPWQVFHRSRQLQQKNRRG